MHINELSSELLVLIFSNVGDFPDKICLGQVCRHWRRIAPLNWEATKICLRPLFKRKTLNLVLNRFGEWLEELWLQNIQIDGKLVKRMAMQMKCLKDLKLGKCKLDGPAMDSMADLFGQQLYSFILDETEYHPNLRKLIENGSSKLDHLSLNLNQNYSTAAGTLLTKLPTNLKSFSVNKKHYGDSLTMLISNAARDCKNLKILHLEIATLKPDVIWTIRNIKSLVYLNLTFNSIANAATFKDLICQELPNLKALRIGGCCSEEILSNIARDRPDLLVHLNVFTRFHFQISDSLNSLTLRTFTDDPRFRRILPETLLFQGNKSLQHLDIRSLVLPSLSNFIQKLLEQFPDLKSFHCKMPAIDAELNSFFDLFEKHLEKGKNITIYLHHVQNSDCYYNYKYSLPHDLALFKKAGWNWKPKMCNGKCENLVLKKVIKEAIGNNEPSFLSEWWME